MSAIPDDAQIAACFQGVKEHDEQALAKIFTLFSRRIFDFAMGYVGNPATAEEVVTETFFEVWRAAGSFCGDSKISTWIFGIARHKALDKLRTIVRRNRHENNWDDSVENAPSHEASALDGVAAKQTSRNMQKALESLPEEQRECILLVFYQDLSLNEVAEIQGVPCNTVKTRLFHARRKLKIYLERDEREVAYTEKSVTKRLDDERTAHVRMSVLHSQVSFE
ncbi:MAG: sigma-70 family RNA polymerase sigma factor [Betaproteobacteria bacterium]